MIERTLRWIAVAIAVAALFDPTVTLSGRSRPRIALVVQTGPSMDLPSAIGTASRRDVARTVVDRLTRDLSSYFAFVDASDPAVAAVAIVGDRYAALSAPDRASISTVSLTVSTVPNVRLVRLDAPAAVPPATAVRIEATLEGVGVRGATTTLVARTAGVEVGRVSHVWSADRDVWHAGLDVVPVGAPPFTFVVDAEPLAAERTALDNAGTIRVALAPPVRVFVFEARPSWASAFVRRALEADPRFHVSELGRMSPKALVVSGDAHGLSDASLADVDVVIAGGLDAASGDDARQLDRFVRARGGALVLLPDSNASLAAVRDSFALPPTKELLLDRQAALDVRAPLKPIEASELLVPVTAASDVDVVARTPGSAAPIVWIASRGNGRLLFSGAMDAWRFRSSAAPADFERFWRAAIAGLGLSARQPISIEVEAGRTTVHVQRSDGHVSGAVATTQRDGKTSTQAIRLLPDAADGEFSGSIEGAAGAANQRLLVAAIHDGSRIEQAAPAEPRISGVPLEASAPPLSLLSATRNGVDVTPDRVDVLERFLRSTVAAPLSPIERRPMQSPWWMVPFAACLSGEWWLRRRRGAR
jgi:hypothetical protein